MNYLNRILFLFILNSSIVYAMEEPNNLSIIYDSNGFSDQQSLIDYLTEPLTELPKPSDLTQFQETTFQELEEVLFTPDYYQEENDGQEFETLSYDHEVQSSPIIDRSYELIGQNDSRSHHPLEGHNCCPWFNCFQARIYPIHLYSHLEYICLICNQRLRGWHILKKHLTSHSNKEAEEKNVSEWFHENSKTRVKSFLQKYLSLMKPTLKLLLIQHHNLNESQALTLQQLKQLSYVKPHNQSWQDLITQLEGNSNSLHSGRCPNVHLDSYLEECISHNSSINSELEASPPDNSDLGTRENGTVHAIPQNSHQVGPFFSAADDDERPLTQEPHSLNGDLDKKSFKCPWNKCVYHCESKRTLNHILRHFSHFCRLCNHSYQGNPTFKTHLKKKHCAQEAEQRGLSHWYNKHSKILAQDILQKFLDIFNEQGQNKIITLFNLKNQKKKLKKEQILKLHYIFPTHEKSWENFFNLINLENSSDLLYKECCWSNCKERIAVRMHVHLWKHLSYTCRICQQICRGKLKTHLKKCHRNLSIEKQSELFHWYNKHVHMEFRNFLQKFLYVLKKENHDKFIKDNNLDRNKIPTLAQLCQFKYVTPTQEGSWHNFITQLNGNVSLASPVNDRLLISQENTVSFLHKLPVPYKPSKKRRKNNKTICSSPQEIPSSSSESYPLSQDNDPLFVLPDSPFLENEIIDIQSPSLSCDDSPSEVESEQSFFPHLLHDWQKVPSAIIVYQNLLENSDNHCSEEIPVSLIRAVEEQKSQSDSPTDSDEVLTGDSDLSPMSAEDISICLSLIENHTPNSSLTRAVDTDFDAKKSSPTLAQEIKPSSPLILIIGCDAAPFIQVQQDKNAAIEDHAIAKNDSLTSPILISGRSPSLIDPAQTEIEYESLEETFAYLESKKIESQSLKLLKDLEKKFDQAHELDEEFSYKQVVENDLASDLLLQEIIESNKELEDAPFIQDCETGNSDITFMRTL